MLNRASRLAVCYCILAVHSITAAGAEVIEVTVIHAGRLLAIPGQDTLERQSIVIRDKIVTRIMPGYLKASDLGLPPAKVRIIDLSDAFLLPGLIDSHVHLASAPGERSLSRLLSRTEADLALIASAHALITLQAGFTTVVDLGAAGVPGHENAIFGVRDAIRKGLLAGPNILSAGTPIAATGMERATTYRVELDPVIDSRSVCSGADDCRRAVRHQVNRGADIIVFYNTGSLLADQPVPQAMSDAEMVSIVETAHLLGRKTIADGHHAQGISAAIRAGADIIDSAHLYDSATFGLLGDTVFLQSHIYAVVAAVGATRETLHSGLWSWLPEPVLLGLQNISLKPFVIMQAYRRGIKNLAYASDAGVYHWGDNAGDFIEFVERGMTPTDAIKTATVNAARMLGLEKEIGSIEVGKHADIIGTSDSPLDDISQLEQVRFVMRGGIVYRSIAANKVRVALIKEE